MHFLGFKIEGISSGKVFGCKAINVIVSSYQLQLCVYTLWKWCKYVQTSCWHSNICGLPTVGEGALGHPKMLGGHRSAQCEKQFRNLIREMLKMVLSEKFTTHTVFVEKSLWYLTWNSLLALLSVKKAYFEVTCQNVRH